jgi:hypothetical protein
MAIPARQLIVGIAIAVAIALGFGFAWGASGRGDLNTALNEARLQLDLAEARGQILAGRVSLYNNNFGDAGRHFEEAKTPLRRMKARYQDAGRRDAATGVDAAIGHIEEAQRLTAKLDPAANNKAGESLDALKLAAAR